MRHYPLPLARLAPVALGGAILLSSLVAARPAQAGLFSFSEQDEIKAGQQVAAQAPKQYGPALPASDPRAQRVRRIGMQFARLSTRKNIPFSYTVLQNEKVLNAFAAPGGPVFITTKLLETTSNDAELAYVLGHETGHIQMRHIAKAVVKQQKVGLGVGILGTILGGGRGGNLIGAASNIAFSTWNAGYSRDHEREADTYGIQQMAKLGYDPRAAIAMLGKLPDGPDNAIDKALADHPSSKSRQDLARQTIQQGNLLEVAKQAGGPRLSDSGVGGSNSTYYASLPDNDGNVYPGDNTAGRDAGPTNSTDLGAPLHTVTVNERDIILAPVGGFARWAGAQSQMDDRHGRVVLSRGNKSISLKADSVFADVNGQSVVMSTPAKVYDGKLYAPVGNLADGTGTSAQYDADHDQLVLSRGGGNDLRLTLPS